MDDRRAEQVVIELIEVTRAIDRLREEIVNIAIAIGAFADATKDIAEDVAEDDDEESAQAQSDEVTSG